MVKAAKSRSFCCAHVAVSMGEAAKPRSVVAVSMGEVANRSGIAVSMGEAAKTSFLASPWSMGKLQPSSLLVLWRRRVFGESYKTSVVLMR